MTKLPNELPKHWRKLAEISSIRVISEKYIECAKELEAALSTSGEITGIAAETFSTEAIDKSVVINESPDKDKE